MHKHKFLTPVTWPVLSYALVILLGSALLSLPAAHVPGKSVSYVDALFVSTSAVCVTGLSPIDISSTFSTLGLWILLLLIQLGGLGITTYTSLVFVLWRNRVPFTDRLAVTQALLNKDIFDLASFVRQVVGLVLAFEGTAAVLLYLHNPELFYPFSALFHAVSAFCNAGFSIFPTNLMAFRDDFAVNIIIATSIIAGGLGFAVLRELLAVAMLHLRAMARALAGKPPLDTGEHQPYPGMYNLHSNARHQDSSDILSHMEAAQRKLPRLDRYSRMVIKTSLGLVAMGTLGIIALELTDLPPDALLGIDAPYARALSQDGFGTGLSLVFSAFFQSVSARTAGFNTVDLTSFSNASLLVIMALMFIGGAPGSCAGGIKITTFRILGGFITTQFRGQRQIILEQRAVPQETVSRALTLFFFAALAIALSVTLLSVTETSHEGITPAGHQPPLLPLLFEVVSALGTVGLSLNLTPKLSEPGKIIIVLNMFVGRVGFLALVTALSSLRRARSYEYPSVDIPVG